MNVCVLCKAFASGQTIRLRPVPPLFAESVGSLVCRNCVATRESRLVAIDNEILQLSNMRPPRNMWDVVGRIILAGSAIACLLALYVDVIVSIILGIIGLGLYGMTAEWSAKRSEPFRETFKRKVDELHIEKSALRAELASVYERYWGTPPDWSWRRQEVIERDGWRCRHCGRNMRRSRVPRHIHHVIPSGRPEGNHSLGNLILLCEICHAKVDTPGHPLVKGVRKTRLKRWRR